MHTHSITQPIVFWFTINQPPRPGWDGNEQKNTGKTVVYYIKNYIASKKKTVAGFFFATAPAHVNQKETNESFQRMNQCGVNNRPPADPEFKSLQ